MGEKTMIFDIDKKNKDNTALVDDSGEKITYGELCDFTVEFSEHIVKRTLAVVLSQNAIGSAMGYVAMLANKIVPLMLGAKMDEELIDNMLETYQPEYIWMPETLENRWGFECVWSKHSFQLLKTNYTPYPMYEDLSLLLTTSGSTGSPKLVRHTYANIECNARNIATFFECDSTHKPILDLPINYTFGLSVLNSHLYAGGTILLTQKSVLNKEYWNLFREQGATTITGVPYTYEMLDRVRFYTMDLPSLKIVTQGGGKLKDELYMKLAQYAIDTGRKFIPTYGQTEGTARMAYLPYDIAIHKCGSIGRAVPNGKLSLVDDDGKEITQPNVVGEMVYEGPNVTLGYAQRGEDLILGDERHGKMATGDIAKFDEDGCYYILGRKRRFLKLFGTRIGLDETERLLRSNFDIDCACTGEDNQMKIVVTTPDKEKEIKKWISEKTKINASAFCVQYIEKIPRNEAGKILYGKL